MYGPIKRIMKIMLWSLEKIPVGDKKKCARRVRIIWAPKHRRENSSSLRLRLRMQWISHNCAVLWDCPHRLLLSEYQDEVFLKENSSCGEGEPSTATHPRPASQVQIVSTEFHRWRVRAKTKTNDAVSLPDFG